MIPLPLSNLFSLSFLLFLSTSLHTLATINNVTTTPKSNTNYSLIHTPFALQNHTLYHKNEAHRKRGLRAISLVQKRLYRDVSTEAPFLTSTSGTEEEFEMYHPLGTLGPYEERWFPEAYLNNHRRMDGASTGDTGVEILSLDMPSLVREGDNVSLTCHFRMLGPNQTLYTVNWWREKDQFFTFNIDKSNNKSSYRFPGINVNEGMSTERSVVLINVNENSSGLYKCEVMAEGPAFKTAVMSKNMSVVIPPKYVTLSDVSQHHYRPGQLVNISCTAMESKPKSILTWRINGNPVNKMLITNAPDISSNSTGRITSFSTLVLKAPSYFKDGEARIACIARINGYRMDMKTMRVRLNTSPSAAYNILSSGNLGTTVPCRHSQIFLSLLSLLYPLIS